MPGNITIPHRGSDDCWVGKLASIGSPSLHQYNFTWVASFGSIQPDDCVGGHPVVSEDNEDIYSGFAAAATVAQPLYFFNGSTFTGSSTRDATVVRLSAADGSVKAITSFGGSGTESVRDLVRIGSDLYVLGETGSATITVAGTTFGKGAADYITYLVKMDIGTLTATKVGYWGDRNFNLVYAMTAVGTSKIAFSGMTETKKFTLADGTNYTVATTNDFEAPIVYLVDAATLDLLAVNVFAAPVDSVSWGCRLLRPT